MIRKSSFWKSLGGKSRKARHGRHKRSYAQPVMGVEKLEDRYMLSANPVLSLMQNQFFGQNTQAVDTERGLPFHATFTDVVDQEDIDNDLPQTYLATIDWGDGSPINNSSDPGLSGTHPDDPLVTVSPQRHSALFSPLAAGDSITGQIEGFHNYATPGAYTVTVTLTDSNGGVADTQSTLVNVYPYDYDAHGNGGAQIGFDDIHEQTPYTLTLDGSASHNQNITSWTISWGDSVETFNGNPSSVSHTFRDDDDFKDPYSRVSPYVPIIAAVTGENGTFVVSRTTPIFDVPPVATADAVSTDVNEGQPFTITNMSYFDPAEPAEAWAIFWGDEPPNATINDITILPAGTTTASHAYANNGTYEVFVAAVPADNEQGVRFAFEVTVHNLPPIADAGGPYTVSEGGSITLDGSGSTDAAGDIPTLQYDWSVDIDHDNDFNGPNDLHFQGANPIFDASNIDGPATYAVNLIVTDQDGASSTNSTTTLTVANAAPTAVFSGGGTVDEGSSANVSFSSQFDSTADTAAGFRYAYDFNNDGTWDIGDGTYGGSNSSSTAAVPTSLLADGDATYNIKARIIDKDGGYTDYTSALVVANVAPTLTISGAASVNEGSSYTLNLSSLDPGADTISHWTINWGDGTQVVTGNPSSVTHTYADGPSSYTISATATDEDGTWTAGNTLSVTVHNVPPTVNDTMFTIAEFSPSGAVVGTVTAMDPGNDTLSYSIVGGTGTAAFAINSATGQITVTNGSLLDYDATPTLTLNVEVNDGDGGVGAATMTVNVTKLASISGVVYVDVNHNGLFEGGNEPGIDGITINLLDQNGNPVLDSGGHPITTVTANGGLYVFDDLQPGTYQVFEQQPTGVTDGAEQLGSLGGTIVANDVMQLTLASTDAFDYAFAEYGQQTRSGDAAGIGFWQNKNGQALIAQGGTQLANWLTSNFGNIFGNTLDGMSGSQVATFYRDQVFKGLKLGGPAKVDAQFMAVALATFFTDFTLAGQVATAYGFNVTGTGIGTNIVNVGTKGAAFNVANGSDLTIMQLLLATNSLTDQPDSNLGFAAVYDRNGDGLISSAEASLRTMANDVFSAINATGGI